MTQAEHISRLQQQSERIKQAADRIQAHFDAYLAGDSYGFDDLLPELDKLYRGLVKYHLRIAGHLDDENLGEAMRHAEMAVWAYVQRCREEGISNDAFPSYCKGIYKHKAIDVVRAAERQKEKYGTIASLNAPYGPMDSLDVPDKANSKELGDTVVVPGKTPVIEEDLERRLRQEVFSSVSFYYFLALVQTDAPPPNSLALSYAQLIPHIYHVNCNEDTIPDSKAASPKWALAYMGDRSIGVLSDESEQVFQQHISPELRWCKTFRAQLEVPADRNSSTPLKDVIYTAQFTASQIGHMAEYMHKRITMECAKRLRAAGLTDLLKDYVSERDKSYVLVAGGMEI